MDIGFYCLGHGVTVADRDRTENGDYKAIAYIRPSGVIEYRTDPAEISEEDREKIKAQADRAHADFMQEWNALQTMDKYGRILDSLTPYELISIERGTPAKEVIKQYFGAYMDRC